MGEVPACQLLYKPDDNGCSCGDSFGSLLREIIFITFGSSHFELKQFCADMAFPGHAFIRQGGSSPNLQAQDGKKLISLVYIPIHFLTPSLTLFTHHHDICPCPFLSLSTLQSHLWLLQFPKSFPGHPKHKNLLPSIGWGTASSTCYALRGHHPPGLVLLTQQDTHVLVLTSSHHR